VKKSVHRLRSKSTFSNIWVYIERLVFPSFYWILSWTEPPWRNSGSYQSLPSLPSSFWCLCL